MRTTQSEPWRHRASLRAVRVAALLVLAATSIGVLGAVPATAVACDITWMSETTYVVDASTRSVAVESVAVANLDEWSADCVDPVLEFPVVPGIEMLAVETPAAFDLSVESDTDEDLSSLAIIEFETDDAQMLGDGVLITYTMPADGAWVVFTDVSSSFPIWATGEDDGAVVLIEGGEGDAIVSSVPAVSGESSIGSATFGWEGGIYPNHLALVYVGQYERVRLSDDLVYFVDSEGRAPDDDVVEGTAAGYGIIEDLLGDRPSRDIPVTIVEIPTGSLGGYAGEYDAGFEVIEIDADLDQATLYHELTHPWFKDDIIADPWLSEGLAEYTAVAVEEQVPDTDGYLPIEIEQVPSSGNPLVDWDIEDLVSDDAEDRVDYGYAASAWVIDTIAAEVGSDELFGLVSTMVQTAAGTGEPFTSEEFLDALETELGYTDEDDVFAQYVFGAAGPKTEAEPTTSTSVADVAAPVPEEGTSAIGMFEAGAGIWVLVVLLALGMVAALVSGRRRGRHPSQPVPPPTAPLRPREEQPHREYRDSAGPTLPE